MPAVPSKEPLAPNRLRLGLLALALSIGVAALAAMLRERLDTSFHTVDDLRAFSRVPADRGHPAARHGARTSRAAADGSVS